MKNDTKVQQKEENGEKNFDRLQAAILFFLNRFPGKLTRITLCKHLYYADGHFFQKYSGRITEHPYLHIEGSPQPVFFNEIMHDLVTSGSVEVIPDVKTDDSGERPVMILQGLSFKAKVETPNLFSREEKKVLRSVAAQLKGELSLETRYFPNLYQNYTQTGLYEKISFEQFPDGKRPHLSWKAWAGKVFRLKWQ